MNKKSTNASTKLVVLFVSLQIEPSSLHGSNKLWSPKCERLVMFYVTAGNWTNSQYWFVYLTHCAVELLISLLFGLVHLLSQRPSYLCPTYSTYIFKDPLSYLCTTYFYIHFSLCVTIYLIYKSLRQSIKHKITFQNSLICLGLRPASLSICFH